MTKVLRNLGNDVKTMVPAPSCPDQWDYWTASPSEEVELMILLPNSVYVSMRKTWDSTLENVKQDLWDQAMHYPLFGMLHEMSGYVFQFVNSLAVMQDVDDETKRIRDIKPVLGVLMIVERSVEKPEVELNTQISLLIGKGLNEFDSLNSSEVKYFRFRMRTLAEENLEKRSQSKGLQRLGYQCPLRLAESPETPDTLSRHLSNNCFELVTKFTNTEFSFSSSVPAERSPQEHIRRVLGRFANSLNMRADQPDNYVLKVCGREEYLYGTNPLIQFLYIQETLYTWNGKPKVTIVSFDILPMLTRNIQFVAQPERRRLPSEHSNTMRRRRHELSWNINNKMNYTCFVHSVQNLNVEPGRTVEVVCQVGIFHGGKPLCESQKTRVANVTSVGVAEWEQELTFNIKVYNLPRMARLCFSIYEVSKPKGKRSKKGANKEIINKLAWANTQIFDYKEQLRTDGMTLSMWTHVADDTQGDDMLLHPLGTVVSNPNTDSCAELLVRFSNYDCAVPIMFPLQDMVAAFSENIDQVSPHAMERLYRDFYRLRAAIENDSIYEIHEQDRKIIWAARERFKQEAPELLPKLLSCVEWGNRAEVASVSCMLPAWPEFDRVEVALELLDYAYADAAVRSFAVKCLRNISDNDLLLYLLQLVQTLKHESYLMCDLAIFLLQRAFKNMTIGHYLFWHLRSEMHVPSVSVRFGLILEAYCRGAQDHIHALSRQMTCLDKLRWVTNTIRDNPENREISKAREALKKVLQERHCIDTLCDFFSPVNPSYKCKKIKPSECRVMDSKMRPLLLDFENEDPTGGDIRIILKIGDDLRQDMFTLQMLRIMDSLWKSEGYDFRLSPYNCISMEYAVGMIEVVDRAETVANIQKQKALFNAASTLQKGVLLQWIREINTPNTRPSLPADNSAFNRAVDEFTWSCAGYSVATYVLGIADRHPDNIMLKKSGQLFHIDFGHFLGNFKRKYGFKRERAPFVLTHDFIHVINKGQRGSGDNEPVQFTNFKDYCEKAFMILRKHGHLILSLFSMMISTGLPELSSEKDLNYLRDTLVLDRSDEKAIEHFRKKFKEAIKNSLSTSLQWAFHNIDKNN